MRRRSSEPAQVLWILHTPESPYTDVAKAMNRHLPSRTIGWAFDEHGEPTFGRVIEIGPEGKGYGMTVNAVRPSLFWALLRDPASTIVVQEINLVALYACLTKVLRPGRRVVALMQADVTEIGPSGSARWKIWFRRLLTRMIDGFASNNADATRYLRRTLKVSPDRLTEGWWLSGFPAEVLAEPVDAPRDGHVLVSIGQLIPRKGHDLLIRAAARYAHEVGPVTVWIIGTGPLEQELRDLAGELGVADRVHLLGQRSRGEVRGALADADLLVFPTHRDLVGRAAVEALREGVPVVASDHAGGLRHILQDGTNAVIIRRLDADGVFDAIVEALAPDHLPYLRRSAKAQAWMLSPDAAADAVLEAIHLAHGVDRPRA